MSAEELDKLHVGGGIGALAYDIPMQIIPTDRST